MSETLIKVEGVSKKFCKDLKRSLWYGVKDIGSSLMGAAPGTELRKGEFWAVRDVSFEVKRGECLGLIGHNGAGKSTLLKMLNGLIRPDEGRIEMRGKIGALIELGAGFNPVLTGRENVYNNGAVLGFSKAEIDRKFDDIVAFAELEEFIDMPVQNYSSGMKVRLGFAVASQMEPDILILDEVLAVGDSAFRVKCFNKIADIIAKTAVIFVSHSSQQIIRICNKIMLMENGVNIKISSDIPEVFGLYLFKKNSFKTSRKIQHEFLEINQLRFYDEKGKELEVLKSGENFVMNLTITVGEEFINIPLRLMIVWVDNEMLNALQIDESIVVGTIGKSEVKIYCEKTHLRTGTYSIHVAFFAGEQKKIIAVFDNLKSLSFANTKDIYAPVQLIPKKLTLNDW